jgi:hypothetical protein
MLNKNIDLKNSSFYFSDYFKLNIDTDELLNEFGFGFEKKTIFTNIQAEKDISILQNDLDFIVQNLDFSSEMMIREFLISPILIFMLKHKKFKLKSEKTIYFNERLKGTVDYYIENSSHFAIIEAKFQDLNSGFKQLAMELIALDSLIENRENKIFGAVTIGTDWIFAQVDRENKTILKDSKIIRIPEETEKLVGILSYIIGE